MEKVGKIIARGEITSGQIKNDEAIGFEIKHLIFLLKDGTRISLTGKKLIAPFFENNFRITFRISKMNTPEIVCKRTGRREEQKIIPRKKIEILWDKKCCEISHFIHVK